MQCVSQPQQYFYDLEGRVLLVLSSSGFKWHMNRLCQMTTPDSGLQTSPRKAFNVTSPPPPQKKHLMLAFPAVTFTALIYSGLFPVSLFMFNTLEREALHYCLSKIMYFLQWKNSTFYLKNCNFFSHNKSYPDWKICCISETLTEYSRAHCI